MAEHRRRAVTLPQGEIPPVIEPWVETVTENLGVMLGQHLRQSRLDKVPTIGELYDAGVITEAQRDALMAVR